MSDCDADADMSQYDVCVCVCVCVCVFRPEHLHLTDASRKSDMHKDGPSKKRSHSVMTAEPQMIPQFPSQTAGPLGADSRK